MKKLLVFLILVMGLSFTATAQEQNVLCRGRSLETVESGFNVSTLTQNNVVVNNGTESAISGYTDQDEYPTHYEDVADNAVELPQQDYNILYASSRNGSVGLANNGTFFQTAWGHFGTSDVHNLSRDDQHFDGILDIASVDSNHVVFVDASGTAAVINPFDDNDTISRIIRFTSDEVSVAAVGLQDGMMKIIFVNKTNPSRIWVYSELNESMFTKRLNSPVIGISWYGDEIFVRGSNSVFMVNLSRIETNGTRVDTTPIFPEYAFGVEKIDDDIVVMAADGEIYVNPQSDEVCHFNPWPSFNLNSGLNQYGAWSGSYYIRWN